MQDNHWQSLSVSVGVVEHDVSVGVVKHNVVERVLVDRADVVVD